MIPPPAKLKLSPGALNALRGELLAPLRVQPTPVSTMNRPKSVIVVRRSSGATSGRRAVVNHDELMFILRYVLLDEPVKLSEWPPDATLSRALHVWSQADAAVCPHGAGTTNMLFMPRGSTIIEIIAEGQHGRVYGSMATMLGHKYVPCVYRRNEHGALNTSLPESIRAQFKNASFSLDLAWFMGNCFPSYMRRGSGVHDARISAARSKMRRSKMALRQPASAHIALKRHRSLSRLGGLQGASRNLLLALENSNLKS